MHLEIFKNIIITITAIIGRHSVIVSRNSTRSVVLNHYNHLIETISFKIKLMKIWCRINNIGLAKFSHQRLITVLSSWTSCLVKWKASINQSSLQKYDRVTSKLVFSSSSVTWLRGLKSLASSFAISNHFIRNNI